jgi:CDP-2,3-bis-(O-geranylgeranyl)-sn-glycerol synthase
LVSFYIYIDIGNVFTQVVILVDFTGLIIISFLYILPAYIANSSAALFGGGAPIDFKKKWHGRRILGDGKTWRGLALGLFFGTVAGYMEGYFLVNTAYTLGNIYFYAMFGFLLSLGGLGGDIVASFAKRRIGIKRGASVPLLDQLDFIVGAMLIGSIIFIPTVEMVVFLLIVTPVIHLTLNFIGYKLRCKPVPW